MHPANDVSVEQLPLNEGVRVIVSNEDGLVALEKPDGLMSHPNGPDDIQRSLLTSSYDYQGEYFFWRDDDGNEKRVWLINRLDSPTSGVILIGLNEKISSEIKRQFFTHRVTKTYYALIRKSPGKVVGEWNDLMPKDVINNGRVIKKGRELRAKARYQLITKPTGGFPISLLKLMPITGRTHQLRVQCKQHGHPIVGDRTYGNFAFNKEIILETGEKRMMLHSGETVVNYSFKGKVRVFRAKSELPEPFQNVLRFRPGLTPLRASRAEALEEKQTALEGRRFKDA